MEWLRLVDGKHQTVAVLHLKELQEDCKRSGVTVYLIHIKLKGSLTTLECHVLENLRTLLMDKIWTETDPNKALEGSIVA